MKIVETWIKAFSQSVPSQIAVLLIISIVFWAVGIPAMVQRAQAAYMSTISDTLTDSNNSQLSKHFIQYTIATSTSPGHTIKVQIDPSTNAFTESFSAATTSDIFLKDDGTAITLINPPCANGNNAAVTGNYNGGSDENITFELCTGHAPIAAGSIVTIIVGSSTKLWNNPSGTGSYRILIGGTATSSGETRVAILPKVTLTASVATTFTFTVSPVPAGVAIGATTTNIATTNSTDITFGELSSGTPKLAAQRLNVTTNAANGFAVTVIEDQPMTANSGATIYQFKDAASTSVPIAWTHPSAVLNSPHTYGHLGLTSTDADLNSNEFSSGDFYAGNFHDPFFPRVIFSHSGPTDGVTANQGSTTVAYRIESTDLLPAGDYTNSVQYVATPVF